MICKSCGSEIRDGVKFCPKCGASQEMQPAPPESAAVSQSNGGTVTAQAQPVQESTAKRSPLSASLIAKLAILLALACFFFTFMSVSCSGQTRKISGMDMISGDKEIAKSLEEYESHSSLFNIFVCLSAVSGLAAIIIRKRKISAGLACSSGVLLLIFRVSAKHYYQIGEKSLKAWEDMGLETHFGFALYLAIVLFFVGAVILTAAALGEKTPGSAPPAPAAGTPPVQKTEQA